MGWKTAKFPREFMVLMDIYHDITIDKYDTDVAVSKVIGISIDCEPIARQRLGVFSRLLQSLPRFTDPSEVKERRLCSRYLQPILQGTVDQRTSNIEISFDFTDEQTMECLASAGVSLSKRRPDGSITLTAGGIKNNIGYIGVKPFSPASNHQKANVDLVRLGVFAKNALDTCHSKNIMFIQAVGMNMTFYLVQRTTSELYTMLDFRRRLMKWR